MASNGELVDMSALLNSMRSELLPESGLIATHCGYAARADSPYCTEEEGHVGPCRAPAIKLPGGWLVSLTSSGLFCRRLPGDGEHGAPEMGLAMMAKLAEDDAESRKKD